MPDTVTDEELLALIAPLYAISAGMHRAIASKPTANRLAILQAVASSDHVRPSDVAAALQVLPPQVSRQLQALVDDGLLTRSPDPHDRRSHVLSVTDAGRVESARLADRGLDRWRGFTADLEPAEVRELTRLLGRLHATIAASGSSIGARS